MRALTRLDISIAAKIGARMLRQVKDEESAKSVLNPFLDRKTGLSELAQALGAEEVPPDAAKLG